MNQFLKENKFLLFVTVLFTVVSSLSYVFIAIVLQKILDIAVIGDKKGFLTTMIFSLFYFLFIGIFAYLQELCSKRFICNVLRSVRTKTFEGIERRSTEDFEKYQTSEYLSFITNDVKLLEDNYLIPLLEILQYTIVFIASLAVMIYFSLIITVCVIFAVLLMFIVPGVFGGIMAKRQEAYSEKLADFIGHVKDLLSGFEVIKSYGMKRYALSRFEKSSIQTINAKYSVDKTAAANDALSMLLAVFLQVVVIFLSAYFIMTGRVTPGVLLGMTQASGNLANPLLMILGSIPKLKSVKPIIKRLKNLSEYQERRFIGKTAPSLNKKISIDHLKFSYDSSRNVIDGLSLNIEQGKKYALVGRSGCGKSTLIRLITGCYSKYEGTIRYDDTDLGDLDLRKMTELSSVIHQNIYMFNESIYHNICLHQEFTDHQMEEALEASGSAGFISQMADGLSHIAGENGANLSGGQKQRIAVARALIRHKPFLILDEGTSAVDMQTAYDIETRLLKLKGLTLVTITHNMNADIFKMYDEIIYMEDGRISEQGSFQELMEANKRFRDFSELKK